MSGRVGLIRQVSSAQPGQTGVSDVSFTPSSMCEWSDSGQEKSCGGFWKDLDVYKTRARTQVARGVVECVDSHAVPEVVGSIGGQEVFAAEV